jgi:stearoyl-CoA desaturase (Delta-9 desaturase)
MVFQLARDSVSALVYHFKEGNLNWPMIIYLVLVHLAGYIGLTTVLSCKWQTLLEAFILWPITGLGITAGVHRLWAHRSYNATLPYRILLMVFNSIANQGSIYHWSRDHRVHHKYSETDADPHNATRGFFFAHMGWLIVKKHPKVVEGGKQLDFSDLAADPVVRFQRDWDPWFAQFMCFVMPALVASRFWGEAFWNAFWVAGALRYMLVLHFTWMVNSAAHLYGDHPYDPTMWPAENPLVSVVAIGEGWHNWHHRYPYDYAASEFGISQQFNPTKAFIDFFAAIGMVTNRKRATGAWAKLKESRARDEANGKSMKDFKGRGSGSDYGTTSTNYAVSNKTTVVAEKGAQQPGWEESSHPKYN